MAIKIFGTEIDEIKFNGNRCDYLKGNGKTLWGNYFDFSEVTTYPYNPAKHCQVSYGTVRSDKTIIPETFNNKTVVQIKAEGFKDTNINYLVIPDTVEKISMLAFQDCNNLQTVVIGSGVKDIGVSAFSGCNNIEEVFYKGTEEQWKSLEGADSSWLNEGVTNYFYCEDEPDKVGNFWHYDKYGEPVERERSFIYSYLYPQNTYSIKGNKSVLSGKIVIPNYYNDRDVTVIGEDAFKNFVNITGVTIPDSITEIGTGAFSGLPNLKWIVIPDTVTTVKSNAFENCENLVIYCKAPEKPNGWADDWCDNTVKVSWGSVEDWMFIYTRLADNTYSVKLKDKNVISNPLYIPDECNGWDVTAIDDYGFSSCHDITEVIIPDSIITIGHMAFWNCGGLTKVVIGNGVDIIEDSAFEYCGELRTVEMGNSIRFIDKNAFWDCYSLEKVVIPKSVISIEEGAFGACPNLSIEVEEGNTHYRIENGTLVSYASTEIFFSKDGYIPKTASSIGAGAFYGKTYFAPIKIPINVTAVSSEAFGGYASVVTIYAEAPFKPDDWADDWCDNTANVIWGYVDEDTCNHNWRTSVLAKPDCTRYGRATSTCTICGAINRYKLLPLGHFERDWIIDIEPTYETEGSRHKECLTCGEILTEEILPKITCDDVGHDWNVEVVEPTCTEGGYTTQTCKVCEHTQIDNYTDPLGHNMVNGICTRCGYSEKMIVYYGVSAIPEMYDSSFILGLENKVLSNSHLKSIKARPLVGEYIYYCIPSSFGDCAFVYNNFVGGFSLIAEEVDLTYSAGLTRKYNIYKSNQANLGVNGAITIKIEEMG